MKVVRNRCKCRLCGDVIESKERHEFVRCRCGEIFTDGGTDYIRRGANDLNNIIDMSEIPQMTVAEFLADVAKYRKRNSSFRHGQAMFNLAAERWYLSMNEVLGSSADPYYSLDTETYLHDRFIQKLIELGLLSP